ncbi:MAG: hypothetical protein WDZ39_00695 [Candidatus Spechtbacterales bacterium]
MPNFTKEQYVNAYNKSPKDIQEIALSDETANALKNVRARYNISKNMFDVSAIIGYTLVGLVPVKKFIQALQSGAGLDEAIAKSVAQDVRSEIFAPVAQSLAGMQAEAEKNWEEGEEAEERAVESRARGMVGDAMHENDLEPTIDDEQPKATPEQDKTVLDVENGDTEHAPQANRKPATDGERTPDSWIPGQAGNDTKESSPAVDTPQNDKTEPTKATPPPPNLPTSPPVKDATQSDEAPSELDDELKDEIFPKPE